MAARSPPHTHLSLKDLRRVCLQRHLSGCLFPLSPISYSLTIILFFLFLFTSPPSLLLSHLSVGQTARALHAIETAIWAYQKELKTVCDRRHFQPSSRSPATTPRSQHVCLI